MGFMDKFKAMRGRMRGGAGDQGPGAGEGPGTPVMAKPGKGRFGGGLMGKMMSKMKGGPFRGEGKTFGAGEGDMPQGAGPESGGPQQLGKFGGGAFGGGFGGGLGSKMKAMMMRRRRPVGGGPGRPGGPPDPRMKQPQGGQYY